jgi:hypothetical protein
MEVIYRKYINEIICRPNYFYRNVKEKSKMPTVNILGGAKATTVTRSTVKPGQVFAMRTRNGKLGKNYAHIGTNGRMYSVNLETGELTSSGNNDHNVVITGKYQYKVNRKPSPNVVRECRRSEVRSGEVFHVNGKETLYAHMGTISRALAGFLSVPLVRTQNHSVTRNCNSRVNVIGTFTLDVELTKA